MFPSAFAAKGLWTTLPVDSPPVLRGGDAFYHSINVTVGSPPQRSSMILSIGDPGSVISSSDCFFCPGRNLFDQSLSSTFQQTQTFSEDVIGLGGVSVSGAPFKLYETWPIDAPITFDNGGFGLWVDAHNTTLQQRSILEAASDQGLLLNPVIGLILNPRNPKLTIGALDPNDYEGEINWVPALDDSHVDIDGFYGFNGSRIPWETPTAALSSVDFSVFVPNPKAYFADEGYSGQPLSQIVGLLDPPPGTSEFAYVCNTTTPTVSLSVGINGVRYPINSTDLLRQNGLDSPGDGTCLVGIANYSSVANDINGHKAALGVPFLRSIYLAYRMPTGDCPPYWGFAFLANTTASTTVIQQKPTSTPTSSDKCLNFPRPTSPPSNTAGTSQKNAKTFPVYGRPSHEQVPLPNVDQLGPPRLISNSG
ncbi:acid protease [Rickenella mellea]|uniref:Acid protease n=1 Tax=Rickenella mellea TaxID=50990 RepID=A0A4Y7Q0M1_9AGAM|nr:acid protease [Rickenella mellea]